MIGKTQTGGGSPIKATKYYSGSIANTSSVDTITIDAVDLTKSVVFVTAVASVSDIAVQDLEVYSSFNSTTEVNIERKGTTGTVTVRITVIEFNLIKSLQHAVSAVVSGDTIAVTSIDTSKYLLLYSYSIANNTTPEASEMKNVYAEVTNATTITVTDLAASAFSIDLSWYLVEFN